MSRAKFLTAIFVTLLPTLLLLLGTLSDSGVTDLEIYSSAPEDILGLGFWPLWFVLLMIEAPALVVLFTYGEGTLQRRVAFSLAGGFVVATAVAYAFYLEVYARVFA